MMDALKERLAHPVARPAILAALLLVAVAWSYSAFDGYRRAALAAQSDYNYCQRDSARIAACRRQPAVAAEQEQLDGQTLGMIEAAAKAANIPAEKLLRITPASAQRVGETDYREKPTQVTLRGVPLEQVVSMMHQLATGEPGLNAKSIQLTPAAPDSVDSWTAEIVFSYLIYDPTLAK